MLSNALQLPSDIWHTFILPCFSVETLGIFDIALAYSSEHKILLQHQANWIWKPERHIYLNSHSLKWVRRRKILVSRCLIDARSIAEIGPAVFLFLCSVKCLQVVNFTDANLLDQLLGCIDCIQDLQVSYNDTALFDAKDKVADCLRLCSKMTSFVAGPCPAVVGNTLHQLTLYCPHITSISLDSKSNCFSQSIVRFLSEMPHLRTIKLHGRFADNDDIGRAISTHCQKITSLTLTDSNTLEQSLVSIVKQCDQLTVLDLSGTKFGNIALCVLAEHCPRLTELNLVSCDLSDSSLQYFFSVQTRLTKLSLAVNLNSELSFDVIARSWRSMVELDIKSFSFSLNQLSAIAKQCLRLRKLSVSCSSFFALHIFSKLRSLTEVLLGGMVNDTSVSTLAQACPQLQVVDLRGCFCVTDASLVALSQHCAGLRELRCGGDCMPCRPCLGITAVGLLQLAANSAQLRQLCVVHCTRVDASAMHTLRDNYPRLQVQWFRSAHILVVDDSRIDVIIRVRMLERAGNTVESAQDGEEALQMMIRSKNPGARPFDLVLTDIVLPKMYGLEATTRLRDYERAQAQHTGRLNHLLIMGTSGMVGTGARAEALQAGMDAYLEIPFTYPQLREEFAMIPRNLRPLNLLL